MTVPLATCRQDAVVHFELALLVEESAVRHWWLECEGVVAQVVVRVWSIRMVSVFRWTCALHAVTETPWFRDGDNVSHDCVKKEATERSSEVVTSPRPGARHSLLDAKTVEQDRHTP